MAINPATGKEDPNYNPPDAVIGGTPGFYDKAPSAIISTGGSTNPNQASSGPPLMTATPQITNTAKSETVKAGPADLVENRVTGIIDKNSPLMQLAASRANQSSNDRGLLSSSMAVGSAQNAVMDAATPIASADSSATNQINMQNATQGQRTSELNAAAENQSAATNIENAMRTNLANLDVSTRAYLADIEQKNKQFIQSSANAATLFNTFQQQVAAIMTSPNLDAAGKEKAVANLQTMLQDSLAAQDAISGLDLAGMLGIEDTGTTGGPDAPVTGGPNAQPAPQNQSQIQAQIAALEAELADSGNWDGGSATRAGRMNSIKQKIAALRAQLSSGG